MKIIEKTYSLNGSLETRTKTNRIILHHAAATNCTVEDIDRWHKGNGWTCIGYHFFVRKNGSIYRGRREDTIGAHAYGSNTDSIGICAEGNFENETMPKAQKEALKELVAYLKDKYGISKVQRHKDVDATACPGKNYPFDEITKAKTVTGKVAKFQQTLNSRYGLSISVDNVAGNTTKWAVVTGLQIELNEQYDKGLKVDGVFGTKTNNACVTLKKGSKGNITYLLQGRLLCLGYTINADGDFGNATLKVVKQFQKDKGIGVDGVVGKTTWNRLFN